MLKKNDEAGVISEFSALVRKLATELRDDPSEDILKLYEMPKISIEGRFNSSKVRLWRFSS
ncbi:hypothetical protein O9929_01455 [Vibrio lentus]|nr:hypothetical protein [Vibrio lentus]